MGLEHPALVGLRRLLAVEPGRVGIVVDFDGTLAPIVDDPLDARPIAASVDGLLALHHGGARVLVASGRPLDFLLRHLPPVLDVAGLYGLERSRGGERSVWPEAERWRAAVEVAANAERPDGAEVERKGLSVTIHVRRRPHLLDTVVEWAAGVAEATGLTVRMARQSVELHPPVAVDKGTVIRDWASGLAGVLFAGDDAGDLPAFAALRDFAADGMVTVSLAVDSPEMPAGLADAADAVIDGPTAVASLLQSLAEAVR